MPDDATAGRPRPPQPAQQQEMPGYTARMRPVPDHGETSYKGSGLAGKRAVITGGDSGIGQAVAIAFAREGADVLISCLSEHEDARETERLVKEAGRKAILLAGDLQEAAHCRRVIEAALADLGGVDILVNNAAHQATFKDMHWPRRCWPMRRPKAPSTTSQPAWRRFWPGKASA